MCVCVCSRHRLSEADEEDELLIEEEEDLTTKVITRFTQSPWCKLVGGTWLAPVCVGSACEDCLVGFRMVQKLNKVLAFSIRVDHPFPIALKKIF